LNTWCKTELKAEQKDQNGCVLKGTYNMSFTMEGKDRVVTTEASFDLTGLNPPPTKEQHKQILGLIEAGLGKSEVVYKGTKWSAVSTMDTSPGPVSVEQLELQITEATQERDKLQEELLKKTKGSPEHLKIQEQIKEKTRLLIKLGPQLMDEKSKPFTSYLQKNHAQLTIIMDQMRKDIDLANGKTMAILATEGLELPGVTVSKLSEK
jgi:hypothetical protein